MKSDIEALRQALAAGPTIGLWDQEPTGHLVFVGSETLVDADCPETAAYIAAANPDRIARLLDALELAQRDAERYRWLRAIGGRSWTILETQGPALGSVYDAATDAAMKDAP